MCGLPLQLQTESAWKRLLCWLHVCRKVNGFPQATMISILLRTTHPECYGSVIRCSDDNLVVLDEATAGDPVIMGQELLHHLPWPLQEQMGLTAAGAHVTSMAVTSPLALSSPLVSSCRIALRSSLCRCHGYSPAPPPPQLV